MNSVSRTLEEEMLAEDAAHREELFAKDKGVGAECRRQDWSDKMTTELR